MVNRKSHTRFRLVPKSTTLDDLEAITHSVSKHVRLSEPNTKIWMKIDYTISDNDVAQWLYRFWQYKVYADIRSGSQDLCKFSLDFMPASLYYVHRKRHAEVVFNFNCLFMTVRLPGVWSEWLAESGKRSIGMLFAEYLESAENCGSFVLRRIFWCILASLKILLYPTEGDIYSPLPTCPLA